MTIMDRSTDSPVRSFGERPRRREDYISIDNRSTEDERRLFAGIAAHKVARQWFGDLVTPKSWPDVWLKEGFSAFFGRLALSRIEPSWTLDRPYKTECRGVLEASGVENARPLGINLTAIKRPGDVLGETSYVNGNCAVYMIFHFLGERIFLASVQRYVRSYYYRTADQEDAWRSFQEEIDAGKSLPRGLTIGDVMTTWTEQPGFPILRVKGNERTGVVQLIQDRFYNRGLNTTSKELWCIPVSWTTERDRRFNDALPKAWMINKQMRINDAALSRAIHDKQWILFNINQTGLYRVNYDKENWELLARSFHAFPRATRAQLLEDTFAIAKAGLLEESVPWTFLEKLETETDELVWSSAMAAMNSVQHALWDSTAFKFVICKLVSKVYAAEVPVLDNDRELWTRFRMDLIERACSVGHRRCVASVRRLAEKILRDDSDFVPETYRTLIYCSYVKVASEEQWLTLLERYKDPKARDKNSLAYALGCQANATLLTRHLSRVLTENGAEERHRRLALISGIRNPYGLNLSIGYFDQQWNTAKEKMKDSAEAIDYRNHTWADALRAFALYMNLEEHLEWLGRLKGASEDYDRIIDEVISKVEINVAWNKKRKSEALKLLGKIFEKQPQTAECAKQRLSIRN